MPANTSPVIGSVRLSAPKLSTGAVTGTVTAGDPDGDKVTYRAATSTRGTVSISSAGVFTYTPRTTARHGAARVGASTAATTDTVTVTVTDSKGGAVTTAVTVPISPKNTAPTAAVSIAAPDPTTGVARGRVSAADADNDPLTFASSKPVNGTVVMNTDGTFSYTPAAGARTAARSATTKQIDSFTITVSDGYGGSKTLGVTAIVAPALPSLQLVEGVGSVSLLRDTATGTAYVQPAGSPAVAVTRADSYWTGPVPLSRGGATLLAAERDSAGVLRVLDSSSYGQFGWTLDASGRFTGEQKYDAATLPGAETLFGVDLDNDGTVGSPTVAPPTQPGSADPTMWTLAWADEFTTPNAKPDPTKWGYDIGGGGYGNAELQYYTDRTQNVSTDAGGHLAITAIKETLAGSGCWYGACQYTSGRILTKNLFTQQYGRFEASMKLPAGQGMWPAFWMQGDATGSAGTSWPARGELDIMENIGREPGTVHGSLHGPGYSGGGSITGSYTLPAGQRFSDGFHTFAVEWDPNQIRWYVDNTLYQTRTRADLPAGTTWVFDHPFYLILNNAVGGQWPGSPDATTAFPQRLLVDYVRVYKPATTAAV